jgi:hypothetical protein
MKHYGGVLGGLDAAPNKQLSFDHTNIVDQESEKIVH